MSRTRVARFRLKVRLGDLDVFQKGCSSHIKLLRKYYGTGLSGKKKNAACISWLSQRRFCCIPHAQRWLPPSVIPCALPVLWRLLVCIILAPAETLCPLTEVRAAYHCCIFSHIFLPFHNHPCSFPNPIQAVPPARCASFLTQARLRTPTQSVRHMGS